MKNNFSYGIHRCINLLLRSFFYKNVLGACGIHPQNTFGRYYYCNYCIRNYHHNHLHCNRILPNTEQLHYQQLHTIGSRIAHRINSILVWIIICIWICRISYYNIATTVNTTTCCTPAYI
jgi:hypothetical protein